MTHVWMRHAEHGGTAQIATAAVEDWRALGWEPCDPPPPPPDPTLVEYQPLHAPTQTDSDASEDEPTSMTEEDIDG